MIRVGIQFVGANFACNLSQLPTLHDIYQFEKRISRDVGIRTKKSNKHLLDGAISMWYSGIVGGCTLTT